MTTTHTHTVDYFANPFLRCDTCGVRAVGFITIDGQVSECDHRCELLPCRHIGCTSTCPSWSPVDGCRCLRTKGPRWYPPPDERNPDVRHRTR